MARKTKSPKKKPSSNEPFPPFEPPKGPTGIRPLYADHLKAYEEEKKAYEERSRKENRVKKLTMMPYPDILRERTPSHRIMHHGRHRISSRGTNGSLEPRVPKTTNTLITVDIRPQPGVSITDQLEPAVRNVQSPCGNFSWGCRSTETTEGLLRISLFHNDTSCRNAGNLARINRLLGKSPATWDCGPPMSIEQIKEKLAMDMRDMIADVHMVVVRQMELVAWSHIDCGRAQA